MPPKTVPTIYSKTVTADGQTRLYQGRALASQQVAPRQPRAEA